MRKAGVLILGALILVLISAVAGFTVAGQQPHHQRDHATFCFAEWCITPTALKSSGSTTTVDVEVVSTAKSAAQRPDHPQAWIVLPQGGMTGGPQARLGGAIGPQQQYTTELQFDLATSECVTFLVSEGAWPPFLGLGYAPSPFTERASWQLCP